MDFERVTSAITGRQAGGERGSNRNAPGEPRRYTTGFLEMPLAREGAGKAAQSPGPGSTVNGTAAELATFEQELYDYQMHSKMCKKIAQLTKVRSASDSKREGRAA
ncbi:hypothetical protein XENOCAPTIV_020845 [Xenoophorus captivus]|uniref:Uncharacterized protein n=1 Tax=Xenoophorus captivus TaxID=1517983 RepID=A0ABV0RCZ4_9TELE